MTPAPVPDAPPRLLLVEDEAHLAFALRLNLTAEGYGVDLAGSVAEARERARGRYDLIVLDVMLPDGSGVSLCRDLRDRGDRTPVLMLTARAASEDVVEGLDAGADDYLAKPFALPELLGRVAALLRRRSWEREARARGEPPVVRFGAGEVDFAAHRARVRGRDFDLTDLELRLLRFFFRNPGRVVSRADLLHEVWGVSSRANTRTVDNFLVRLRRLFEHDPASPRHFLTVRGVGYRFVPEQPGPAPRDQNGRRG